MRKQKSCNNRQFKRQQQPSKEKQGMHMDMPVKLSLSPALPGLLQSAIQSASGNPNGTNASHVIRTTVLTSNSILLFKVLLVQTRVSLRLAAFSPLYSSPIKDFQQHLNFPLYAEPPIWYVENSAAPLVMNELQQHRISTQQQSPASRCCYTRVKLNG